MKKKEYYENYPNSIFGKIPDSVIKGIDKENKAYSYPIQVQIDLTNNCNFNCVGCWCHSELMQELKFSNELKKQRLNKKTLMSLIDDLADNGTREIQLSGSGEPSIYPYFMDIVRKIKSKGLILHIITNFSLFTKSIIDEIINLEVDMITISLWSGTSKNYIKTHPNQSEKTFLTIKKNLSYLNKTKKSFPLTKIYNVISNKNYKEVKKMVEFAYETRSEFVEFQILDSVKGKSESLSLSKEQKKSIIKQLKDIVLDLNYTPHFFDPLDKYNINVIRFYEDSLPFGFSLDKTNRKIRCKKNFISNRYYVSIQKNYEEVFMPHSLCINCDEIYNCYPGKPFKYRPFKIKFLRFVGYIDFLRKLEKETIQKNINESKIVDEIPCTIGWTFARILPNGDVIPCCKAHKKPLGNINKKTFNEIWNSNIYNEFRKKSKTLKKNNIYFEQIQCYKSCDNLGMNREINEKLKNQKGKKI